VAKLSFLFDSLFYFPWFTPAAVVGCGWKSWHPSKQQSEPIILQRVVGGFDEFVIS
jgi:hypothetical protein